MWQGSYQRGMILLFANLSNFFKRQKFYGVIYCKNCPFHWFATKKPIITNKNNVQIHHIIIQGDENQPVYHPPEASPPCCIDTLSRRSGDRLSSRELSGNADFLHWQVVTTQPSIVKIKVRFYVLQNLISGARKRPSRRKMVRCDRHFMPFLPAKPWLSHAKRA